MSSNKAYNICKVFVGNVQNNSQIRREKLKYGKNAKSCTITLKNYEEPDGGSIFVSHKMEEHIFKNLLYKVLLSIRKKPTVHNLKEMNILYPMQTPARYNFHTF